MSPPVRRRAVADVRAKLGVSERRACRILGLSRSVLHYQPAKANAPLQARLVELAGERRRFGYRRLHILLEREGWTANHKRVYRLYRNAGLAVQRRRKRERVAVERRPLQMPSGPNHTWSMDFVFDALANGRAIKCLTVVDDCTKEAVEIAVDHKINGQKRRWPIYWMRHAAFAGIPSRSGPTRARSSPVVPWINGLMLTT